MSATNGAGYPDGAGSVAASSRLRYIHSTREFAQFSLGHDHPMQPVRLRMLHELLLAFGLDYNPALILEELSLSTFGANPFEQLPEWHDKEYLDFLRNFSKASYEASIQDPEVRRRLRTLRWGMCWKVTCVLWARLSAPVQANTVPMQMRSCGIHTSLVIRWNMQCMDDYASCIQPFAKGFRDSAGFVMPCRSCSSFGALGWARPSRAKLQPTLSRRVAHSRLRCPPQHLCPKSLLAV